jgi:hypothetical protein
VFDTSTVAAAHGALPTTTILERLIAMTESPWGDLHGKPITDRHLSMRLRQYGVKSKVVRIGDKTPRGYAREDLHDVWLRYPSSHKPEEAQQAQQPQQTSGNGHFAGGNVADDADSEAQQCCNERNTAENVADSERNTPSERNTNNPTESTPVADVADVADVRGDKGGRVCAQCNAGGELFLVAGVWLHLECRRFWFKEHPDPRDCGPMPESLRRDPQ